MIDFDSKTNTLVWALRLTIGLTGISWALAAETLNAWVATIALALTFTPALLIHSALLGSAARLILAVLLAAHIVLGMHLNLYEASSLYDKCVHLVGSSAVGMLIYLACSSFAAQNKTLLTFGVTSLAVFAGTVCIGALWEIFEFSVDLTGAFQAQRGLRDTMFDLIADALGALLALILIGMFRSGLHTGVLADGRS